MPPFNPPESYCPPSTSASGWHVNTSQATGEAIPYFIGEASESKKTLVMHLVPLKHEHRDWPPIQTFPIQLVLKVPDEIVKEKEDAQVNERD